MTMQLVSLQLIKGKYINYCATLYQNQDMTLDVTQYSTSN
jgi:hypothetical protein